jgi:tyrosine-protein kinase Etk/Wzc
MLENKNSQAQNGIDSLDPKRIVGLIISKWYIFIGSIFLALILAFYINRETTPIYSSQATLLISEKTNAMSLDIFSGEGGLGANTSLQNEIVNLNTFTLAKNTVKKVDLNVAYYKESLWRIKPIFNTYPIEVLPDWKVPQLINTLYKVTPEGNNGFTLEIMPSENKQLYYRELEKKESLSTTPYSKSGFPPIKGKFGQVVSSPYFEFILNKDPNETFDNIYFRIQEDETLAKNYRSLMQIKAEEKGNTALTLKIEHPDKNIGVLFINTLMNTFLQKDLEQRSEISQQALDFIQNQISSVTDSLYLYENELQSYRTINQITNLSQKGDNILSEVVSLESELNTQTVRLEYYQNLQQYLTNPEGQQLLVPSVIGIEDPIFNTMVSNLLTLQNEKSGLSGVLSGDSFAYTRELNNKIANLKVNLNESNANAILNISTHIRRLKGMLGVVERDLTLLPEVERNLTSIQRRFKINEEIYTFLLQRKAETEIQKASTISEHRILDAAMLNSAPIYPQPARNYAIAVSLGFIIPLAILIIWSLFYHKVVDPKEMENLLMMPVLGYVPREKIRLNILNQDPKSSVAESFRSLRSNLAIRFNFKNKGTLLVTSTQPGEGKTYISIKIASAYASLGKKTILLGMDIRKPAIRKELTTIHNDFGVTTFLLQESEDWENFVQQTEQENLFVLNAGPYFERSAELFSTKKFEQLISSLKEKYDFVIIDTPPIGLVSETLDLVKFSDVSIFVLRQNYSFLNQVNIANDLKVKMGFDNFYVVLNDMHKFGLDNYNYGYGYGYYSGYNLYTEDQPKPGFFKRIFS